MNLARRVLCLVVALTWVPAWAEPAEYAIRWVPKDGGPADIEATLLALKKDDKKLKTYQVRYFNAERPKDAPAGLKPIVRERVEGGDPQVTWKYRSQSPLPPSTELTCPLRGESAQKSEADVSVISGKLDLRTNHSWSCTASGDVGAAVPKELAAKPLGCSSEMTRRESKDGELKVERWSISNGAVVIEVSWTADLASASTSLFIKDVVQPLLATGIHPIDRTKTELGTQCQ